MEFLVVLYSINNNGFASVWWQWSKLLCKLPFTFTLFLKVSKSKSWEFISKSSDKNWEGDKKIHLSSNGFASSSEISSIGQLLRQCPMWVTGFAGHSEINDYMLQMMLQSKIIVLIWVSVVLFFLVLTSPSS